MCLEIVIFQIAAEVAAPLAKTDEIVLLGGADRTTTEINKLVSQLPPAVSALTGVDLSGVSSVAGPLELIPSQMKLHV